MNKGQPRKVDDWGALRAWQWFSSRGLVGAAKEVEPRRRGPDGMRECRHDPDAPVASLFVGQVLGALVALRDPSPPGDLLVEPAGDDGARV